MSYGRNNVSTVMANGKSITATGQKRKTRPSWGSDLYESAILIIGIHTGYAIVIESTYVAG